MADQSNLNPGDILAAVDALREQAVEAAQRAAEQLELERRMEENPMGTLAWAAGAGFLLGGGLWPLLRPLLRTAARTLVSPQNLVALAAAAGAMKAARAGDDGAATPGSGTTTSH